MIVEHMSAAHRECDAHFAAAEAAVADGDWAGARDGFAAFLRSMQLHFEQEESVLFPAIEAATGQGMGPTQVMRMEHLQIRGLMSDLERALGDEDQEAYLGLSETLLVMMQQHNMKEEQILYPMADQAIEPAEVLERMRKLGA